MIALLDFGADCALVELSHQKENKGRMARGIQRARDAFSFFNPRVCKVMKEKGITLGWGYTPCFAAKSL
jgi:hypothetical protein